MTEIDPSELIAEIRRGIEAFNARHPDAHARLIEPVLIILIEPLIT